MKRKNVPYLLTVGVAGIMSYFGNAMAEDAPAAKPVDTPVTAVEKVAPEASPQKKASDYNDIKQRLEQAFKESEECDKVYWVNFSGEDVLVCDEEEDGKRRQKYGVNLAQICDVRLQENYRWYVFEWLGGDDVITSAKNGEVTSTRFWDDDAEKIYQILNEHIEKTVPQEERERCNQRYATRELTTTIPPISHQSKESCEERQKRTSKQLSQLLQTEFDHVKIDAVTSDEPLCFKDLIVNCYDNRAETSLEPLLVWRFNFDKASCLAKRMKKPLFGFIDDYIDHGSNHLRNIEIESKLEEISAAYVPNGKNCGGK